MFRDQPLAFLDIETGPQLTAVLEHLAPEFEAPANLKDPAKIAAAVARKREDWLADAALSPLTGKVLAVGFLFTDKSAPVILEGDEPDILSATFETIRNCAMGARYHLAGFNIHLFDLPFLTRRAWVHDLKPPPLLAGRYFPAWIIDLREVWTFFDRHGAGSLDAIGKALGFGGQHGTGAQFARLYGHAETKAEAIAHLVRDLELTAQIAGRIL